MREIIYDVAISADGFICGENADISRFPHSGAVVDSYRARLATYGTAVMGRATYEFGYQFGLPPGASPYPHMTCYVFSATLNVPDPADVIIVRDDWPVALRALREADGPPIYLCGGGMFAGWMLGQGLIDRLCLKRAPIFYGSGIRLFGNHANPVDAELLSSHLYDDGVLLQEYALPAR